MSETDFIDEIAGVEEEIPQEDAVQEPVEAAEAPAEEPVEEKEEPKETTVPLGALHEERSKRQELQSRLDETIQKMGKMEALWEQLQNKEATPELPDYEEDPAGYLHAQIEQLQAKLNGFEEKSVEQERVQEQQQTEQQLLEKYAASVRTYSQEAPDFNDAYQYLSSTMDQDLVARGYDDPLERANILQYEEGLMVGRALNSGKNPAEIIYNYAKARGYAQQESQEEDKLERIEKGQQAAQTLNGPSGGAEPPTTLERLAELADADPAAFDAEWEKARRTGLLG